MNPRATIVTVSDLHLMLYDQDMKPRAIALSVLSNITNNFSEERIIGSGGFADVYKGIVEHDLVAVKKITEECMDDKEYNRELECLLSVKHKNIVRFIGYCGNTELDMRMEEGAIVNSNKEKRLLCFEYVPKGNLDDLIKDPSTGLAWRNRYKIIKGICEGLSYLHQINILHLDLKPGNILLGENEVPKITDFGLSRYFTGDKTCVTTTKFGGTMGYMAPEHSSKEITPKFDLYSLGVIIIELITGKKGCPVVDNVIESWKNRVDTSEQKTELKQIRVCVDIGIACIDANPAKRPDSMKHIMDKLAKMECVPVITAEGGQNLLLDVHTRVLYFPFESNKVIPCSLDLKNNTNEHVAFKLMRRGNKYGPCFVRLPMYGLVPPMSTYTLILTTEWRSELERINISMILESKILGDEHIQKFQSQPESIFENFKEMGNEAREVKLIAVYTTQQRSSKILDMSGWFEPTLYSLDTNLVKQWVIIGGSRGHVEIWNYHTQIKVDSLRLSAERAVTCVKFIARKQWFVAATERGDIHVYNYRSKIQAIMSLSAGYEDGCLVSLVVHPTQPYLLTVSGQEMKLWNWDKGWECVRIYTHRLCSKIYQVAFNQEDTIAIASEKHEVEIRSLDSGEGDYKLLSGHSNRVNCLHFFTSHGQEYLVTGSTDKSAKIWDMEEKICVRTLQTLSPVMYVLYQPSLEILITGSKDGLLYLWSTAKSRLEKVIYFGYGGDVHSLTSFTGRVVIGKEQTVAIIDIEDNNYVDESKDYGEEAVVTTSVRLGYKTQELLDVHPLELHFHRGSHNTSSLHLTNKTDEHVVFRVTYNYDMWSQCFINLPLYGTVAPGSTCRLVVATDREVDLSREVDMVLESSILGGNNLVVLTGQLECHTFISKAKEFGHWVHEVALKLFYTPTERETTGATRPPPKITGNPYCLDAHPTKPWVITGYDRELRIWNFDSQELVHTIELSEETVERVKFDLREQWIVAQTFYGSIHVYDCACVSQIKKIATFRAPVDTAPRYLLLAIHPTKPHVLTLSDSSMELWDGDKDWECTQIFGPGDIRQCAFNLKDPNSFATGSLQPVVKIWSLDTYKCEYVLYGHSESVNCLAYFTSGGRQYLITGSNDCTAKIWDLQERACIHTIAVFMCPVIHAISIPGRPYLVTCSENATIHWWSSTDFRLGGTINLITYGRVHGLVLLTGSRRIAVGQSKAMTILSIDEDEKAAASEGSNKDSTCEMG